MSEFVKLLGYRSRVISIKIKKSISAVIGVFTNNIIGFGYVPSEHLVGRIK